MFILREKCVKHIYLIVIVLIQITGSKTVQGLKCVQCGGTTGTDCKDDLSDAFANCEASTKCYTQIESSGKITRGCLTSEHADACTADKNCVPSEDGKNNQLVCKTCSKNDADCSQTDAKDSKLSQVCDAGISKCIKKITDKFVVRGCATQTDVSQCTDKNTCETCEGVNCNTGVFPPNRLKCYQCSGETCNDVTTNAIISKPCLLFEDKDECYTKGESNTSMVRGCKSDTNENKCTTTAEGCAFCTESGCNNLKYKGQSTLKCYQCISDSTNTDCSKNPTDANLKTCAQEVLYNQVQYCYTQREGGKIQRGCLSDNIALTPENCKDEEGGTCTKCNGDGCNGNSSEFSCIRCRSDINDKCWQPDTSIKGEKCRTGNSSAVDGCFHGVWYGVLIRGCMIDASLQTQALCKDIHNPNKCEICHSKDCNTKASSGAKSILPVSLISLVLIRVALWSFK